MNKTLSNDDRFTGLVVKPETLAAYFDGAREDFVSIDRLNKGPHAWLHEHHVYSVPNAEPVILMLDPRTDCPIGTVAFLHDEERPLALIDRAIAALEIAALEIARAALVKAGHEDYEPKRAES